MSLRTFPALILAAAVLLLAAAPASAERCPCGDLLLPYFEVELPASASDPVFLNRTATFAVGNCTDATHVAHIRVWSNWGVRLLDVEKSLGPREMFTANLRDWLVFGRLPDRQLTADELAHLQAALSGLPSPTTGLYYGTAVAPGLAVGFITAGLDHHDGGEPVLWGDWFDIDPREEDAGGESLVRLVNDETRELCEHHLVRFIEGARFEGHTHWLIWTPEFGQPSPTPLPDPAYTRTAVCQIYDEAGTYLGEEHLPLIAAQMIRLADLGWPSEFGWAECDTAGSAFMAVQHTAGARYDLKLRSFCMDRRQPPIPPPARPSRVHLEKSTQGEDADLPPGPTVAVGEEVTWEYVVTNGGETTLEDVRVVDDPPADVVCPGASLPPGASMTCTAHGTALPGQFHNLATVTARGDGTVLVRDTDPSHYSTREEPPPPGDRGCTPGYWKNHLDSWPPTGYDPSTSVVAVFPAAAAYPPDVAGATLLAALGFGGGAGVDGAAKILLRAGVAALLNASHPGVTYPRTPAQVLTAVDAALAAGERDGMLLLAAGLDADNNLGCPL